MLHVQLYVENNICTTLPYAGCFCKMHTIVTPLSGTLFSLCLQICRGFTDQKSKISSTLPLYTSFVLVWSPVPRVNNTWGKEAGVACVAFSVPNLRNIFNICINQLPYAFVTPKAEVNCFVLCLTDKPHTTLMLLVMVYSTLLIGAFGPGKPLPFFCWVSEAKAHTDMAII